MNNPMAQVYKSHFPENILAFRRFGVKGPRHLENVLAERCYLSHRRYEGHPLHCTLVVSKYLRTSTPSTASPMSYIKPPYCRSTIYVFAIMLCYTMFDMLWHNGAGNLSSACCRDAPPEEIEEPSAENLKN